MIGRELSPQQPISELLRPVTAAPGTHVHDTEEQMQ